MHYKPLTAADDNTIDEDEEWSALKVTPMVYSRRNSLFSGRLSKVFVTCGLCFITFLLGTLLGEYRAGNGQTHSSMAMDSAANPAVPEYTPLTAPAMDAKEFPDGLIAALRGALPDVNFEREYGIGRNELGHYSSNPVGEKMCILSVDTRPWDPNQNPLYEDSPNPWGYLNHWSYSKLHGYKFKYVQVPEHKGLHNAWVKPFEQYRMTIRDECQFVLTLDADIIFTDLRVPLEALLDHWNVTSTTAVTGARGLNIHKDIRGHTTFNTGFMITQNTPDFEQLMRDWILCTTDVKYPDCSRWGMEWPREQAAFSNYIRYSYAESVRELDVEEIHLGKFVRHYWNKREKARLRQAAMDTLSSHLMPVLYQQLAREWDSIGEVVTMEMYEALLGTSLS